MNICVKPVKHISGISWTCKEELYIFFTEIIQILKKVIKNTQMKNTNAFSSVTVNIENNMTLIQIINGE
jgi:hypothetical protein